MIKISYSADRLKTQLDFNIDHDFLLYAISCHLKDYRVCWYMNKILNIELGKEEDFTLVFQNNQSDLYSLYHYFDELNRLDFNVVKNIGNGNYLVKECKHIDYFLVINGFYEVLDKDTILASLRSVSHFLYVCEMEPGGLKSKDNLIFE